jgi:hypothetical protein
VVALARLDQRWKPKRFEVRIRKPYRQSLSPCEVPSSATAASRCYPPAVDVRPTQAALPGDDAGFSTDARELRTIDAFIVRWAVRKYKRFRGHTKAVWVWLRSLKWRNPNLFAHWGGLEPAVRMMGAG